MLSALGALLPIAVAVAIEFGSHHCDHPHPALPEAEPVGDPVPHRLAGRPGGRRPGRGGWGERPPHQTRFAHPRRRSASPRSFIGFGSAGLCGDHLATGGPSTAAKPNRWLDRVERMGPVAALGLAFALNLRPKGLLLGSAAGLSIAGARLNDDRGCHRRGHLCGLASSTVIVPIVATLVSPVRMEPRLVLARDWLSHNGAHVTVLVLVMVGFVILGAGLSRL